MDEDDPFYGFEEIEPSAHTTTRDAGLALGWWVLGNVVLGLLGAPFGLFFVQFFAPGVAQLPASLFAFFWLRRQGEPRAAWVVVLISLAVLLLNGSCFAYVFSQPMSFH